MAEESAIHGAVGGDGPFFDLVEEFYRRVESNSSLRRLYPVDLEPGKLHLGWFLIQRFGGPDYFSQRRGAPRLRMRHAPFEIGHALRDAWIVCMREALDAIAAFAEHRDVMMAYFDHSATFLINHEEPAPGRMRLPNT